MNSAPSGPSPCRECGRPGGKVPEIAFLHVTDRRATMSVKDRDAAISVSHDCPLGLLMPMQLPDSASGKPHVHGGYLGRDREVGLRHLPRSAAVLDALWREIERRPELRHAADIR